MELAAKMWYDGVLYPHIKLTPLADCSDGSTCWCYTVQFSPTAHDSAVVQADGTISIGSTESTAGLALQAALNEIAKSPEREVHETNDEDLERLWKGAKKDSEYWRARCVDLEQAVRNALPDND